MDSRIVTRNVSFCVTDVDGSKERNYIVSYSTGENFNESKELWINANGMDISLPMEDVPLLVQALKEFC